MLGHRALNVEDYLTIVKRRWWIILIPTIILPIGAVGLTYVLPPKYVSQTVLLIDQQKVPADLVRSVVTESTDSRLAYMTEQILSRASIQPIIERYNLYSSGHLSMDQRIDQARNNIDISPLTSEMARTNGLPGFKISFTANDPRTALQVCTDIEGLFTTKNLQTREAAAEGTTDYFSTELDNARHALDDQNQKIADFEREHLGMLPGDEGTNVNVLNSLESQLDAVTQNIQTLQQNRSVGETLLQSQLQNVPATPGAVPVETPQVQQEELDKLLKQKQDMETNYTDAYPGLRKLNRQIDDLRAQMASTPAAPPKQSATPVVQNRPEPASVQSIRAQLKGIDQQIENKTKQQEQIMQQIHTLQGRVQATPEVEAEYKALTRDLTTTQQFYDKLQSDKEQSQMATDLEHRQEGETFSLLDAPNFPTEPTFPKPATFAAGGVMGGLALGVLIVAFLEYKDTAMRTERDVWAFTQLPTLAILAWSGDVAEGGSRRMARLKRLFGRKPSKELLAGNPG